MKTHAGNTVLIGFGAMILFMIWLVYQCTQNPSLMVSKDYYKQELVHQEIIDAKQTFIDLKTPIRLETGRDQLELYIPDTLNKQLSKINISFFQYANPDGDSNMEVPVSADGVYRFDRKKFASGKYRIDIDMYAGSQRYFERQSVTL